MEKNSKTILGYERKRNDHDSYPMVLAFTLMGYVHNERLFDWVGDDYPAAMKFWRYISQRLSPESLQTSCRCALNR